jgi:hypothetical protein
VLLAQSYRIRGSQHRPRAVWAAAEIRRQGHDALFLTAILVPADAAASLDQTHSRQDASCTTMSMINKINR